MSALDVARTPNLDSLCRQSLTGMMRRRKAAQKPSADTASTGLSALEIDLCGARPLFDDMRELIERVTVDDLPGVENELAERWDQVDLFVLNLDRQSFGRKLGNDLTRAEWIEILDAWLPGLLAVFGPDVFALSGDIRDQNGSVEVLDPSTPLLLHSRRSRALQGKGFTLDRCRKGGLGVDLSLRHCLLLLLAHE